MKRYRHKSKKRRKTFFTGILLFIVIIGIFIQNRISSSNQKQNISGSKPRYTGSTASDRQEHQVFFDDWNLMLVNSTHPVPEDFSIETVPLINGQAVDSRILKPLQDMMDAARADGLSPLICSSYRTDKKQKALYDAQVKSCLNQGYSREEALKQAAVWVAPPGTSEHQLGLAVDIVSSSYQLLDEAQENTPEQKWLMRHCAEYGFILRYPTNKSNITGIGYEPWHYRYVGTDAAKTIMEQGICLEEYLGQTPSI